MNETTAAMTLTEFLLARIADDEHCARAAQEIGNGQQRAASLRGEGAVVLPASECPDDWAVPPGHWGWSGGPLVNDHESDEGRLMTRIFGELEREDPERAYLVTDSALWSDGDGYEADLGRARAVIPAAMDGVQYHIARHDPARVLAECEAKRRIVERFNEIGGEPLPPGSSMLDIESQVVELARDTLLDLALPYADHPDYRESWRP